MVKPIYEFVLWDNCKNNCKFCWQKKNCNNLSIEKQLLSLVSVRNYLNSSNFSKNSHILLIGGEIFDTNADTLISEFMKTVKLICKMMLSNCIDLFYINTNLLNTNEKFLKEFLDAIKEQNLTNRLKFTTSYDIDGRFNDKTSEEWHKRLRLLHERHQNLNVVINTILTSNLCKCIIDKIMNPVKFFEQEFGYYVSVLPFVPIDAASAPSRHLVFDAMRIIDASSKGYIQNYLRIMNLNQRRLVLKFDGEKYIDKTAKDMKCGHCENFSKYSNSNTCFACDLNTVFSMHT